MPKVNGDDADRLITRAKACYWGNPAGRGLAHRIAVATDEVRMGELAAKAILADIEDTIRNRGKAVMLFASAQSQHSTWKAMIDLIKKDEFQGVNAEKITAFHMDEYLGLKPDAPQLFGKVLKGMLFEPMGIREENVHYFNDRICFSTAIRLRVALANKEPNATINKLTRQLEEEANEHTKVVTAEFIDAGGVFDIVVGGIGKHPHLAFNDAPHARFDETKTIKVVRLSETSRQQQVDDGEFMKLEDVLTHALTFTLPPIFKSRKIHIIIPKAFKANAVRETLDGPISEEAPASGLRMPSVLPKVKFYLDKESARLSKVAQEVIKQRGYR